MRPEELVNYLATIRTAVASDLKPDLKSDNTRAEAGSIVTLLDRLITILRTADSIAASRLETWQRIRSDLRGLGLEVNAGASFSAQGFMGSVAALSAAIADLQKAIGRGKSFERFTSQLAARDTRAEDWYARAVAAFIDLHEAGEPQTIAVAPRQQALPEEESERLRSKLAAYLRRRFPTLPPDAISRLKIAPGGHCKQTSIFSLVPNDVLPTRLVLRRDLELSITGAKVTEEYPVIERAYTLGLPVPKPILVESDASVLGGSFMLMTEVVDAVSSGTYFPEERRAAPRTVGPDFGKEVAAVLARLHSGTRTSSSPSRTGDLTSMVRKHYEDWCALPSPPFSATTELSYAWLLAHPLPQDRPHCLIHGDIGTHNIVARDGHIAALLDWELAHEGDPAEDIAQCRMMLLPDTMPWGEFAREYVAAGGDPAACEENAVAYYCVWTYLKHGLMNSSLRDLYLTGARDDMIAAIVSGHYYYRLMQYQARALQIAIDTQRAT